MMGLAVATRNLIVESFAAAVDAGGGPGHLKFYGGAQPYSADQPVDGQPLLGTLTFAFPAADEAVGGVLSFNPIEEESATPANGVATWARAFTADGAAVFDADVGDPGSGATIELNSTRINRGGPLRVKSFTISMPAATG